MTRWYAWYMSARGKKVTIILIRLMLLFILVAGIGWHLSHRISRVPYDIRAKTSFVILLPSGGDIQLANWRYNTSQKQVEYVATVNGKKFVITQQAAPLAYQDNKAAYDRFVGTLRPVANFKSPIGNVSIFPLVEEVSYISRGESAVLLAKGTLLVAHPQESISDEDWASLFRTMQTDR